MRECECTDNVSKDKYVCTIFTELIILHVYSHLDGFQNLIVFTVILFHNTREKISKEKLVQKACHYSSLI